MKKKKNEKKNRAFRSLIALLFILVVMLLYLNGQQGAFERGEEIHFRKEIRQAAKAHDLDPFIIAAVARVESSWQADAKSPVGASGLMQLMPATAMEIAEKRGMSFSNINLDDPSTNIDFGSYYLKMLRERFSNWDLVFAAYNAGPTRVEQWLRDDSISSGGKLVNIPFQETKQYIEKVNHFRKLYKKQYGEFPK